MAQNDHSLSRLTVAFIAVALVSACSLLRPHPAGSSPPPQGAPPPTSSAQPSPSEQPAHPPPPAARENRLSPATRSLVSQARTQVAHGDLPAASSTLDRALRIEPSNPLLWVELGRLRLAENDAHQAEGCGRKALALASGDHAAQTQAGRLLADALRAQRRNQEAREVESQPFMNSHHD
jgi:uncharacterized protein HemY